MKININLGIKSDTKVNGEQENLRYKVSNSKGLRLFNGQIELHRNTMALSIDVKSRMM